MDKLFTVVRIQENPDICRSNIFDFLIELGRLMKKVVLSILFGFVLMDASQEIKNLYSDVNIGWPSPTPWLKERFNQFLQIMPKNAVVAEVGVQEGTFSSFIIQHTDPIKLYLIDCWEFQDPRIFDDPEANVNQDAQDELYNKVKTKFSDNPNVIILKKYSKDAASMFPDEFFDWVYIDSNHAYEAVKEDLSLWYPKVKKGGFICGHDYLHFERHGFGITKALNEFMRDNNLYFTYLTDGDVHESWAVQKPKDLATINFEVNK